MELENDNHTLNDHLVTLEEEHNLSRQTTKKKIKTKGSEEKVNFTTIKCYNSEQKNARRRSLERNNEENQNINTSYIRNNQIKELTDEVRMLNEHIKNLKQKNLDLFHKNNELEEKLSTFESRDELGKIEYSRGSYNPGAEKDLVFWRNKCETLVRKYMNALRSLKEDNEILKKDVLDEVNHLRTETSNNLKTIKKQYKNVKE